MKYICYIPKVRFIDYACNLSDACSPSASTVDQFDVPSRLLITTCFCDTIQPPEEGYLWENLTLDVNGDTTTWTISGIEDWDLDKCITWQISGGPLSYGDVITFKYDHSGPSPWVSMEDDVDISVTNTIPAPVQLLTLPAFDTVTGRLNPGLYYNTRTTQETFNNSDGMVETVAANRLIYSGSRIVQNLAALTAMPVTQNITVVSGRKYLVSIGAGSAVGATAVCSNAFTGTLTGDGANRITFNSGVAKTAASTTLTVTITGSITDLQCEDVTAKAVQNAPGEYESVGVGGSTGYGIYNRANGNTVDGNGVVTDTPGALLATAPVLRHAPAAINYLWPSTPNSTNWTIRSGALNLTLTTSSEVTGLGAVCQVRGLGAIGANDFFRTGITGGGASLRHESCCYIRAVSTSGIVILQSPNGSTYGKWRIDLSAISTTRFERIDRNHPAVIQINNEFISTSANILGLLFYSESGTLLNFDLQGCQQELGLVSTPAIPTTTASVSRNIDSIRHPYSAGVFNPDEGTLIFDYEYSSSPGANSGVFGPLNAYYTTLYQGGTVTIKSLDSITAPIHYVEVAPGLAANKRIRAIVRWSKANNIMQIGAIYIDEADSWSWSSENSFKGYEVGGANLLYFFVADFAAGTKLDGCKVLDSMQSRAYLESEYTP